MLLAVSYFIFLNACWCTSSQWNILFLALFFLVIFVWPHTPTKSVFGSNMKTEHLQTCECCKYIWLGLALVNDSIRVKPVEQLTLDYRTKQHGSLLKDQRTRSSLSLSIKCRETWIKKMCTMNINIWIDHSACAFWPCAPTPEKDCNCPFSSQSLLNMSAVKTSLLLWRCLTLTAACSQCKSSKQILAIAISSAPRDIWLSIQIVSVSASLTWFHHETINEKPLGQNLMANNQRTWPNIDQ